MDIYIGIMSGTSLDGIDLVAAKFEGQKISVLHQGMAPFPGHLKDQLLALSQGATITLEDIGTIDSFLGLTYAKAVNDFLEKNNLNPKDIRAIGCHGQTVFHKPTGPYPFTMQLGDANIIAAHTNIITVADFRRKDMALGGQGAPLVPAFHQAVLADEHICRVVLNIGGIANISVLAPHLPVVGFDTGPGNMLMDSWIKAHLGFDYDKNGDWASAGKPNEPLLFNFLSDPYFTLAPPKSTGRERFHPAWLTRHLNAFKLTIAPEDVQATLLALTARSIAQEIEKYPQGEVLVCGGGARNTALMTALQDALPLWRVLPTDERGIDSDSMEALAFAWLAKQTMEGKPGNLPQVTGASRLCRLGAIYYPD